MRKITAAINVTLDGYCDHTAINPDDEIHQHYADLLKEADITLYGRITFELMKYWQTVVANPTGIKATDEFAVVMDGTPKIVFSHTLKDVKWHSARLATHTLEEEVKVLKLQPGKDVLAGSRSIIIALMKANLLDELQLCIHPVIAGSGLPLFENLTERMELKLSKTKTFRSGAIIHYYERAKS